MRLTPTEKLIDLLAEEGFSNVRMFPAMGAHRRHDVHRWEAIADRGGKPWNLYSWNTITECARNGIQVHPDEDGVYGFFEILANAKRED